MNIIETIAICVATYLVVGCAVGKFVTWLAFRETNDKSTAYNYGVVVLFVWPIAINIMLIGLAWFCVFKPILTPKAVKENIKAEYEKRVQAAVAKGINPKDVPKKYVPVYEDD